MSDVRISARQLCQLDDSNATAAAHETNKSKLQRQRQVRRKPVQRRPRYYWLDSVNLRSELCLFWRNCGVETNSPTIPTEVLLMHYERHDLRAAIAKNGGRIAVSELLGGAPIMPGRWRNAVASSPELQHLLKLDASLTPERPPRVMTSIAIEPVVNNKRWSHHNGRNLKGYWSLQTVVRELYVVKVFVASLNVHECSYVMLILRGNPNICAHTLSHYCSFMLFLF